MLRSLSHAVVYVLDLDEAKRFYVEVLGLEERVDVTADGLRWLTVGVPDDPDHEIVLTAAGPPMFDDEAGGQLSELIASGRTYGGVFATSDCAATHRELASRGVAFLQEPTRRFNRIEAVFRDQDGNWFSLAEPLETEGRLSA
jgi:catechol 2,3-dioxygenase-like lactoylglutathione lyase family enzyme